MKMALPMRHTALPLRPQMSTVYSIPTLNNLLLFLNWLSPYNLTNKMFRPLPNPFSPVFTPITIFPHRCCNNKEYQNKYDVIIIYHSMALHSQFNENFKGRLACGLPILQIRTKFDGPGSTGFQTVTGEDIIDQAFKVFRVNVLFKNFQIKGPGDKVLIYLLVLLSYLFKSTEQLKQISQVEKKLGQINAMKNPLPKQKSNFLAPLLDQGFGNEVQTYLSYLKQLKAETISRFQSKFYQKDGFPIEDYKYWSGLGRKKFMGLNFVSLF